MQNEIGRTLRTGHGAYRIHELVAAGGFGSIYYGRDLGTNTPVAVKLLHPHHTHDARVVRQFEQEAELFRGVRHPNVAQVLDQGRDEHGAPFIVQEWVTGWTIAALLQRNGAFAAGEAAADVCQALDGLEVAWQRGVIHRDIKPLNLMVTADGLVKVMDFGIAKDQALAAASGSTVLTGTPAYMAPEQFRGDPIDGRVDLYALGVTLYEMLTGKTPFDAPSWTSYMYQHLEKPPPPLATIRPDLNQAIIAIVERAMAKSPADRFASPSEMRAALVLHAGRATQPAPLPRLTEPSIVPPAVFGGTLPMQLPPVQEPPVYQAPRPVAETAPVVVSPPAEPPRPAVAPVVHPAAPPTPGELPPSAPAPTPNVSPPANIAPSPVDQAAGVASPAPGGLIDAASPAAIVANAGGRMPPGRAGGDGNRTLVWMGIAAGSALVLIIGGILAAAQGLGLGPAPSPTQTPTAGVPTATVASTPRPAGTPTGSTPGVIAAPSAIARGPITLGQTVRSELRNAGERHAYTFVGLAEQDVQIAFEAPSSPIDPYLVLLGPDGRSLVEDDDSGEGVDARIHWQLARAGTYTIVVRDLDDDDAGAYTLTISPGRFVRVGERTFPLRVSVNTCGAQPAVGQTIQYRLRLVSRERNAYIAEDELFELAVENGAFRDDVRLAWPRLTVQLGDDRRPHRHIDLLFSSSERATLSVIEHRVSPTQDCYIELS